MDALKTFNIDINQGGQIDYFKIARSVNSLTRFVARAFGADKLWAELFLGEVMNDYIKQNPDYPAHLLCTLMYYETDDANWNACMARRPYSDLLDP